MTRLLSISSFGLLSISSFGLALAVAACGSETTPGGQGGTGGGGAVGGTANGGTAGTPPASGGASGTTPTGGTSGGTGVGGSAGGVSPPGGTGGGSGSGGVPPTAGVGGGSGGLPTTGGAAGLGGTAGGTSGGAGMAGSGGTPVELPPLVTSTTGAYWKTDVAPTESTATATVTVNDTMAAQKWDGFGGAFNELGWSFLTTPTLQTQAMMLLFSAAEGAAFAWGRIPMGASDYAMDRYTCDDSTVPLAQRDPTPSGETNRPGAGTFSLARDGEKLIPYIKAAQAVKPDLRFWASPWTPPVSMKTGFKANSGADSSMNAKRPSFYDGGNMKSDDTTLAAYAEYYKKFVEGYKAQNINIEIVSPQNEPGYDQNYPSCLWDNATYTKFIGQHLGPKMMPLNVKIMLGTLSNDQKDFGNASAALADATAKSFLTVIGAQWNTLDQGKLSALNSGLPVWATEHKCGNYPWNPSGYPAYNNSQAPNDQAYAVESWGELKKSIRDIKVTSYNAWNMVLNKSGLGIDTTRDWKQNALLVADSGTLTPTPTYYVFRHLSQYAQPGATVVGTTGGDAIAFKNPDGSLVAVMFNSGAANPNYVVAIGGKKLEFAMPANGWATVKVKP